MKKIIIALTALGALQACGSEIPWKSVASDGSTDDYIRNVEYDEKSHTLSLDFLSDFVRPVDINHGESESSVASLTVDCKSLTTTTQSIVFYAEPMGRGDVVLEQKPQQQEQVKLNLNDPRDQKIKALCERPPKS